MGVPGDYYAIYGDSCLPDGDDDDDDEDDGSCDDDIHFA